LRYEDFDGFGIRGAYGTGFKAPTPGQSNASNTSTELTGGVLVNNATIPATNAVALANESKPPQAEESTNMTLGAYLTVGVFDITVDLLDIDVEDRLNLSSEVTLTPAQIAQLVAGGVPGAGDLTGFRFFTNDVDTNTRGFGVIVSTDTEWLGGVTKWNLAYNNSRTDVTRFNAVAIGAARIRQIEEITPDTR
jgi:iron complex outermembrane receptor protein